MSRNNGTAPLSVEGLPINHEAELAVISAILNDPDAILESAEIITPDDFHNATIKTVYKAMLDLFQASKPFDAFFVQQTCKARGVDCDQIVIDALVQAAFSGNIQHYASMVKAASLRRRLRMAAGEIATLSADSARDVNRLLDEAESALWSVRGDDLSHAIKTGRVIADQFMTTLEELRSNERDIIGIPTGFADIDRLLSGLQAPHMYTLAARPGMGKSALAINIAIHAAMHGHGVLIFSLEMSQYQVAQRIISSRAGINSSRLQKGKVTDEEYADALTAAGWLSELPIYVDPTAGITPAQIRAKAMRQYAKTGLGLIVIDHLHLMRPDKDRNNRVLEISDMTASITALGKQLNVPILVLAQLSRACEQRANKRPMLSDLRDSGAIEQDSYAVLFLYRDHIYNTSTDSRLAEVTIAKHREGPAGSVDLYWNETTTTFGNLKTEKIQL